MLLGRRLNINSTPTAPGVSGHRYWRALVTDNNGDLYVGILELELYEDYFGPNIATSGTYIESGHVTLAGTAYSGNRAFNGLYLDGNIHLDGWAEDISLNPWVGYDFGSGVTKDIIGIGICSRGSTYGADQAPKDFDIQYSDDGSTWTTAWSEAGRVFTSNGFRKFFHPSASVPSYTGSPHGAHRYWQLGVLYAAASPAIGELELRSTPSGADATGSGTPTASTEFSGSYPASNAFDNNTATLWSAASGALAAWVRYDFGTPVEIAEIALKLRTDGFTNTAPLRMAIQFADGTSGVWTTAWGIATQSGWSVGEQRIFTDPSYI